MTIRSEETQSIEALLKFVCDERNLDFAGEKRLQVQKQILERMEQLEISDADRYGDYLQVHPAEYKILLQGVFEKKQFLLNEEFWTDLNLLLEPLTLNPKQNIRAWVIGAGNGNEAFGTAMALGELFGPNIPFDRLRIFATDTDEERLTLARQGTYDRSWLEGVLDQRLISKYFETTAKKCIFKRLLRQSIIFGRHDVTQDSPIGHMDLIVCRQVMPLLDYDKQMWLVSRLLVALNPTGLLILGKNERLPSNVPLRALPGLPFVYMNGREELAVQKGTSEQPVGEETEWVEFAFDTSPLAAVCVSNNGTVAGANAQARSLFSLEAQDIGKPLQDLEISYRPLELRSLIELAYKESREVVVNRVVRGDHPNNGHIYDVFIRPLRDGSAGWLGVNIQFHDATELYDLQEKLTGTSRKLNTLSEELQSAHEELETTNEELQSTNEELETTNEELQSTNEELETINEELHTTNAELELSNDGQRELAHTVSRVNAFLESILASMHCGIIAIDRFDNVMIWNDRCAELFGVRSEEAVGSPFFDLDIGFPVSKLREPLTRMHKGASGHEELSTDATNRRGKKIECSVKISALAAAEAVIVLINEKE